MVVVRWLDDMWQVHNTTVEADTLSKAEWEIWQENKNCISIMFSKFD